jgi:hypothetical protein
MDADVLLRTRCGCTKIVWIHDMHLPEIKVNLIKSLSIAPDDFDWDIETRTFKHWGKRDPSTRLRE